MDELISTALFENIQVKPLISSEKDKYLALASLASLKDFLPSFDASKNTDLLAIAFNACVANRVNRNDDIIDTETAIAIYKHFINKPINIEHNRKRNVGVILTAGFSEYGTDRPLTEEQVKDLKTPFNVTLGGVIWKKVDENVANAIEESSDPDSRFYQSISASWELGFYKYRILLLDATKKNLDDHEPVSDAQEFETLKPHLRALKGSGSYENKRVCRMIFSSEASVVVPNGIGLTENPAAEVKGILVGKNEESQARDGFPDHKVPDTAQKDESFKGKHTITKCSCGSVMKGCDCDDHEEGKSCGAKDAKTRTIERGCAKCKENEKNISHSTISTVNTERHKVMPLKFKSIEEITDESLKQSNAASIGEFIGEHIREKAAIWQSEKQILDKQLVDAKAAADKASEDLKTFKSEFDKLKETIASLEKEKKDREAVEKFNERMSSLAEVFEFDDEASKAVVEEVKAIASDEDFAKYQKKAEVLFKHFKKEKAAAAAAATTATQQTSQASATAATTADNKQTAVDNAVDNAAKDKAGVTNTTSASEPKFAEKFSKAFEFTKENFDVKL